MWEDFKTYGASITDEYIIEFLGRIRLLSTKVDIDRHQSAIARLKAGETLENACPSMIPEMEEWVARLKHIQATRNDRS